MNGASNSFPPAQVVCAVEQDDGARAQGEGRSATLMRRARERPSWATRADIPHRAGADGRFVR